MAYKEAEHTNTNKLYASHTHTERYTAHILVNLLYKYLALSGLKNKPESQPNTPAERSAARGSPGIRYTKRRERQKNRIRACSLLCCFFCVAVQSVGVRTLALGACELI